MNAWLSRPQTLNLLSIVSILLFVFRSLLDANAGFHVPAPTPASVSQSAIWYSLATAAWMFVLLRVQAGASRGSLWALLAISLFIGVLTPLSILAVFCPVGQCTPDWSLYNPAQYASILIGLLAALAAYFQIRALK